MISDIPSSDDFKSAGKAQFDFAWDIVVSFLKLFDEVGDYDYEIAEENEEDFWEAAKQRVLSALAITQQGVELILKGKIAEISPYLLIAGNPSEWPKGTDGGPLTFSDFRTIDAQDLVKIFNTVSNEELFPEFISEFDSLRRLRNRIMHTVDRNLKVTALEVVTKILEMHDYLIPGDNWVETRHEFLSESPMFILGGGEGAEAQLAWEFYIVHALLKPAEVKRFFDINKKQRNYICPECLHNCADFNMIQPSYAVLKPNKPTSETLYCFVCRNNHPVTRVNCTSGDCKGNVISDEYDVCCTCGE